MTGTCDDRGGARLLSWRGKIPAPPIPGGRSAMTSRRFSPAPLAAALIALAASASAAARPQAAPPAPKLEWQHDWKSAQALAAAENKLLLVCVMKDTEPACVEMMEKV